MQDVIARAERLAAELLELVGDAVASEQVADSSDDDLVRFTALAGLVGRAAEGLAIGAVVELTQRSHPYRGAEGLSARLGCRSVNELVERTLLVAGGTAARLLAAGRAVKRDVSLSSGERMPATFPAVREALYDGAMGLDGVIAVVKPLNDAVVAGRGAHLAADEELAASARGLGADGAPPATPDDLRNQACVWATYLDQDGSEPKEARALRKRGVRLGVERDGVVPIHGNLLPETASQLRLIWDSINNPKVESAAGPQFREVADDERYDERTDPRSQDQKRHDALATALAIAAGSGDLPLLGGAPPTLVVSVREEDLDADRGRAHVDGADSPVPLSVARHVGCTGRIERVTFDAAGRIVSIGILDRVFNHHQRRAIALRDGGCIIPGCHVRATWCEIHHVEEHVRGGPTHTDNGVLLCWFHHRTLDQGGWRIRMRGGVPEVRGPMWWDPGQRWRAVTTSPTRLRDRIARSP